MSDQPHASLSAADKQFVQELTWKMLDDCISEEEAGQLDLLLLHSAAARYVYTEIVQLHVDLLDKFGGLPRSEDLIKKILDKKLTERQPIAQPPGGEIPTTEPSST